MDHYKIDIEKIKTFLCYDPLTGDFQLLPGHSDKFPNGKSRVGSLNRGGYWCIHIYKKPYPAHRLGWAMINGHFPKSHLDIDHINRNKLDNRYCNLRLATRGQNNINSRPRGSNRLKGAYRTREGKLWRSQIKINNKSVHLGHFRTEEEAHQAWRHKAGEIYGYEFLPL